MRPQAHHACGPGGRRHVCGACDGEHHREACQRHRRRYGVLHVFGDDVPVIVCPAMNTHMYENAATQANLATLAARGIELVGLVLANLRAAMWLRARSRQSTRLLRLFARSWARKGRVGFWAAVLRNRVRLSSSISWREYAQPVKSTLKR